MNAVDRFTAAAAEVGLTPAVQRFPEGTRTAADAAAAVGCEVGQIVKSLIFSVDGAPILILTSGANQVDTELVGGYLGASLEKADAALVPDPQAIVDGYHLELQQMRRFALDCGGAIFEPSPQETGHGPPTHR